MQAGTDSVIILKMGMEETIKRGGEKIFEFFLCL